MKSENQKLKDELEKANQKIKELEEQLINQVQISPK
jgi:hypothetical protein